MNARRSCCLITILTALALLVAPATEAGMIWLKWDAVPEATAYRVYWGTAPGQYDQSRAVVNPSATLTGIADCATHYAAVKSINANGESAQFSNEVSGWPRPRIERADPSRLYQGDQLTVNLYGANFSPDAQVLWEAGVPRDLDGNPLLRLEEFRVVSCRHVQALVTVESAARGFRPMEVGPLQLDLEVVNPDSVFGSGHVAIQIDFALRRADINRQDSATSDRVDGKDLAWLGFSHGSVEGGTHYNPDADLDGNGVVDGDDLALLAPHFGRCWSGSGWTEQACR